jgi:hypothetical protein
MQTIAKNPMPCGKKFSHFSGNILLRQIFSTQTVPPKKTPAPLGAGERFSQ